MPRSGVSEFVLAPPSAVYRPRPVGGPIGGPELAGPGLGAAWFEDSFDDRTLPLSSYGVGAGDNWGAMSDGLPGHSWAIVVTPGAGKDAGVVGGRGVGRHSVASADVLDVATDTGLLPVHLMVDAIFRVGPDAAIGVGDIINLNIHAHSSGLIGHVQIQRNAGVLQARSILENAGAVGAFAAFVAGDDYHLRWEYNSIGANVERMKSWRDGDAEPGAWDVTGVPTDPTAPNGHFAGNERVVWQFAGLPNAELTFDLAAIRGTFP